MLIDIRVRARAFGILSMLACLAACDKTTSPLAKPISQPSNRLPSATEVFHLRSECAKLGVKMLSDVTGGMASSSVDQVSQTDGMAWSSVDQVSRYDSKTNRCYILISILKMKPDHSVKNNRYLYDGQTGEQLAFSLIDGGAPIGSVHAPSSLAPKYSSPDEFIDTVMKEER
jgi:hypothetical protein